MQTKEFEAIIIKIETKIIYNNIKSTSIIYRTLIYLAN